MAARHTSRPVALSTATRAASRAPGVKTRRSPSTRGDSLHIQLDIIRPP